MRPRRLALMLAVGHGVASACDPTAPTAPNPTIAPPAMPMTPSGFAFSEFVNVHGVGRSSAGEPSLQISRDGILWSTDLGPAQLWTSSDRGATWSFVAPPSLGGGGDMDAAQDDAGRVHVVDLGGNLGCILY